MTIKADNKLGITKAITDKKRQFNKTPILY